MDLKFVLPFVLFLGFGCVTAKPKFGRKLASVSGGDVRFLSNVHKAKEVLLFGNMSTTGVVLDLSSIVDEINQSKAEGDKIKLRYFAELQVESVDGVAEIMSVEEILEELDLNSKNLGITSKAKELPKSLKHAIAYTVVPGNYGYKPDLWMQDYGQFYQVDGQVHFLDLSYSNIYTTSEIQRYIRSPLGLSGKINSEIRAERTEGLINKTIEGGDVEVMPNGTILTGSELHPDVENYLVGNLGQKVLKVPADIVETGHVDEIFSFVPAPKEKSNGCGYALTYTDPMYGLRLAVDKKLMNGDSEKIAKILQAVEYFTGVSGEEALSPSQFGKISKSLKDKDFEITEEPWGMSPNIYQWYVYKSLKLDLDIKEGVRLIKEELSSECADLVTIGMPVIISDQAAGMSSLDSVNIEGKNPKQMSDAFKGAGVNFALSPVNQVVLDEHLIVPIADSIDSYFWGEAISKKFSEVFKWIVPARLKKIGVLEKNVHFISSETFIRNGGAVHCGTATVRSDERYFK